MPFNHSTLDYMIPTGINKDTSLNNRSQSREFSKTFKRTHFNEEAAGPAEPVVLALRKATEGIPNRKNTTRPPHREEVFHRESARRCGCACAVDVHDPRDRICDWGVVSSGLAERRRREHCRK